jgi:hypothetical protein
MDRCLFSILAVAEGTRVKSRAPANIPLTVFSRLSRATLIP